MLHIMPAHDPLLREKQGVKHGALMMIIALDLFIDIIGQEHIHKRIVCNELLQSLQDPHVGIHIHPVITVNDLKINTAGIGKSGIDCAAVSTVFLMNCFDDGRIFLGISIRNLRRAITGSVIYNNNLNIFSTREQ